MPEEREMPEIIDRVDGCKGHYCIARPMLDDNRYTEFYNSEVESKWSAVCEVFPDFTSAVKKYQELGFTNSDVVVKYSRPRTRYEIARG